MDNGRQLRAHRYQRVGVTGDLPSLSRERRIQDVLSRAVELRIATVPPSRSAQSAQAIYRGWRAYPLTERIVECADRLAEAKEPHPLEHPRLVLLDVLKRAVEKTLI